MCVCFYFCVHSFMECHNQSAILFKNLSFITYRVFRNVLQFFCLYITKNLCVSFNLHSSFFCHHHHHHRHHQHHSCDHRVHILRLDLHELFRFLRFSHKLFAYIMSSSLIESNCVSFSLLSGHVCRACCSFNSGRCLKVHLIQLCN